MRRIALAGVLLVCSLAGIVAAQSAGSGDPGVPRLQVPFAALKPTATFRIGGAADWVLVTDDAVWVAGTKPYSVQRIDPVTNKVVAKIILPGEACSGLEFGFGSVWAPVCGAKPALARIDAKTNRILAMVPIAKANAEGGITASTDSVWMVTDKEGATLSRINPTLNTVEEKVPIPAGSYNPVASGNTVWITSVKQNVLTAVDGTSGAVIASIPVGPKPRFLTVGGNAIWTLNQGDGSVTRVDENERKVTATIALGIPGPGGDIDYGVESVWATVFGIPLTEVDAQTNRVARQWVGRGGDSLRFGFDSIWLTDYKRGLLWRIPVTATR